MQQQRSDLRRRRFRAGLSQRDLAETFGVYQATISRIEKGKKLSPREQEIAAELDRILPLDAPLTEDERERLEDWIDQRAVLV
jgi:transcriptional regulator with XRE-family HTH domain